MPRVVVASATLCTARPYDASAHRHVALLHRRPRRIERLRDDVVELRVHLGLLPEVLLEALHPLEVRHDHAAGVGEHVRQNEHAHVVEDDVRGRRDRAVRALDDHPRLDCEAFSSVITCSSAHGARMSQSKEQLLVGDLLRALQPFERARLALLGERGLHVDAVRVVGAVVESEIATTRAPSSATNFAKYEPTLPKPCTAIRGSASERFCFAIASRVM